MGFLKPKTPPPPPPPPPAPVVRPKNAVTSEEQIVRKNLTSKKGKKSTILSGPRGDLSEATIEYKSLLGS